MKTDWEQIDRARNERDEEAERGYDYDRNPRVEYKVSEHVTFVQFEYGCDLCGEPAGIITPLNQRLCGPCLRIMNGKT